MREARCDVPIYVWECVCMNVCMCMWNVTNGSGFTLMIARQRLVIPQCWPIHGADQYMGEWSLKSMHRSCVSHWVMRPFWKSPNSCGQPLYCQHFYFSHVSSVRFFSQNPGARLSKVDHFYIQVVLNGALCNANQRLNNPIRKAHHLYGRRFTNVRTSQQVAFDRSTAIEGLCGVHIFYSIDVHWVYWTDESTQCEDCRVPCEGDELYEKGHVFLNSHCTEFPSA